LTQRARQQEGVDPFVLVHAVGLAREAKQHVGDGTVNMKKTNNENVDAATKERDKARLRLRHAKQRHTLSVNQEKEKDRVKNEEVEQVAESQVLSNKKKELSSKMFGDVKYLNPAQRKELDKAAKAAVMADREAKKAKKAEPAAKTKTSKGKTHTGSGDPADRNLIMQLRKAQDALSPENFDILVSPTGKTINLPKKQIDDLLKKHDSLGKPVDKRKFKIMLTKALRAKAK
jgi:hypothetical protein